MVIMTMLLKVTGPAGPIAGAGPGSIPGPARFGECLHLVTNGRRANYLDLSNPDLGRFNLTITTINTRFLKQITLWTMLTSTRNTHTAPTGVCCFPVNMVTRQHTHEHRTIPSLSSPAAYYAAVRSLGLSTPTAVTTSRVTRDSVSCCVVFFATSRAKASMHPL
jgi:hypothetical protein